MWATQLVGRALYAPLQVIRGAVHPTYHLDHFMGLLDGWVMVGSKQHVKNYLQLANFDYVLGKGGFFGAWALGPVQRGPDTKRWPSLRRVGSEQIPKKCWVKSLEQGPEWSDTKRWSSLRRVGSEQIPKSVGSKVWNRALFQTFDPTLLGICSDPTLRSDDQRLVSDHSGPCSKLLTQHFLGICSDPTLRRDGQRLVSGPRCTGPKAQAPKNPPLPST